jgi:hypothetical protein
LPDSEQGAQRASARKLRSALTGVFAALVIVTAMSATAPQAHAASQKVVIVVGPVGSATDSYRHGARRLADKARSYGAHVVEIFSPYATWSRVHDAAQGANVLIYLGHGNGWPSPYRPFMDTSKDGMGLNASSGHGNSNTKYYGEYYMARLGLASHAVVVLNRLCYASGNNEWGAGNPTLRTAKKRVDNYGYGFIKGGAQAVFASGITDVGYVLKGLFTGSRTMTMAGLFWTDPTRTVTYKISFDSRRISGVSARMDPYKAHRYYRSVVGRLNTTVGDWRSG